MLVRSLHCTRALAPHTCSVHWESIGRPSRQCGAALQERIQKELLSFGLCVFNGNVAEMRDNAGNEYFSSLKQKAISGATQAARVEVRRGKGGMCWACLHVSAHAQSLTILPSKH